MLPNRLYHLLIVVALLVITACTPQVVSTQILSTATLVPAMESSPTLKPTTTPETSPTLISAATLFEGQLLFSRFDEAAQSFSGMFIVRSDGSAETEIPLPWTEAWGQWSRSGKEIALPTLLPDERVGT